MRESAFASRHRHRRHLDLGMQSRLVFKGRDRTETGRQHMREEGKRQRQHNREGGRDRGRIKEMEARDRGTKRDRVCESGIVSFLVSERRRHIRNTLGTH